MRSYELRVAALEGAATKTDDEAKQHFAEAKKKQEEHAEAIKKKIEDSPNIEPSGKERLKGKLEDVQVQLKLAKMDSKDSLQEAKTNFNRSMEAFENELIIEDKALDKAIEEDVEAYDRFVIESNEELNAELDAFDAQFNADRRALNEAINQDNEQFEKDIMEFKQDVANFKADMSAKADVVKHDLENRFQNLKSKFRRMK